MPRTRREQLLEAVRIALALLHDAQDAGASEARRNELGYRLDAARRAVAEYDRRRD